MNKGRALYEAIDEGDLARLKAIHSDGEQLFKVKVASAGGTWMHHVAAYGTPELLAFLKELGFDQDAQATYEYDRPIVRAAGQNNVANTIWLLAQNCVLDTDASVRNPLFAAITSQSSEIVERLLNSGIDAKVQYNSATMKQMDAMAFALFRGAILGPKSLDLATLIARHLAKGDPAEMRRLLEDAENRAKKNGTPKVIRLVPTDEELSKMRWDEKGNLISE